MLQRAIEGCNALKDAVVKEHYQMATDKLNSLKALMLEFDSLPPLNLETESAELERALAREILEYAVLLAIKTQNKDAFQRNLSSLRPYYTGYGPKISESESKYTILGLNLLFLLVENRLADFHCELELLTEQQQMHPSITFCTQLDQHLMVGSYDQVMLAAAHPPEYYSFFLTSLLETVRLNISECAAASYQTLSIAAATKVFMFQSQEETLEFIAVLHPDWQVDLQLGLIDVSKRKSNKTDNVSAVKLLVQNLSYATELERIV